MLHEAGGRDQPDAQQQRAADREKLSRPRYKQAVKVNNRAGLITNVVFYLAVLPFCVSLEPRPLWRHAVDVVVVLVEVAVVVLDVEVAAPPIPLDVDVLVVVAEAVPPLPPADAGSASSSRSSL